jgi:putative colanic acid biosynthesis UDP-glucose lipid carrier transferase
LFITSLTVSRADALNRNEYYFFSAAVNLSWMASVYLLALYLSKEWLDFERFSKRTLKCYVVTLLSTLLFIFFYHFQYSRLFFIIFFSGFGFALLINRAIFYILVMVLKRQSRFRKNVIVLGYNDISKRLISYFQKQTKLVNVVGCFEDKERVNELSVFPIIGDLRECMPFAKENNVTEIYSTLAPENYPYLYELANEAESHFMHFKFVPDYHIFVNRNIYVDFVDDIPILSLRNEPLEDTGNRIKKRLFDVVFSLFVIVFILSWLIPLMAILIKLDSKGPVFFIQLRSGKSNQPFRCYKFRSLRVNTEAHTQQVTRGDQRITKLGRFMRKSNIDELPQFINVFLGDMSIVGPRPHMLKHTEDFSHLYKQYMIRHFVKPGLTGWAQVHGFRGEIRDNKLLRKRIEHDIWYMESWSLWLDVKIILMTIYVTVLGDKNAF